MVREQSLSTGEAIDQYMPMGSAIATMNSIDEEKTREIAAISKSDPQYEKKVKAIQ